jgi:hypothetical protein
MAILKLESAPAGSRAAVARIHGNYHVVATELLQAGDLVLRIEGDITRQPTRYTVQIDADHHIEVPAEASLELLLDRYFWRFLNHSCDPSAIIRGRDVIARRRIKPMDEVTFDYDSTEYDMAEPFHCRCGSPRCRGRVGGYRHLSAAQRRRIDPYLAAFLRDRPAAMETPA